METLTSRRWALDLAVERTRDYLIARQHADGHWCAELEGDSILESEYLLLQAFLGCHETDVCRKIAICLQEQQGADGGWRMYPGAPIDISASAKAYFALKLMGHDAEAPHMQRARQAILASGGADAVNSFTRFYLAFLGQISYSQCPAVPPEAILLPTWLPINLYAISAWSRTMVVTLSLIWAKQPVTQIDERFGIRELFVKSPETWPLPRCPGKPITWWDGFFRAVDTGIKWFERRGLMRLRSQAVRLSEKWIVDRFHQSEGLGAIFPPMVWSMVALRALGYADDSKEMTYCRRHLDDLMLDDGERTWLQPCKSPVWDTAIALRALEAAGVERSHAVMTRGFDWLLENEISLVGDWRKTVNAEPSGWCFEYANAFYPDVDDTVMVLMALAEPSAAPAANGKGQGEGATERFHRMASPLSAILSQKESEQGTVIAMKASSIAVAREQAFRISRLAAACDRGERWVRAMQNSDGGWGAFDRNNDREFLCCVPFADHNAMIDPSTPDLAGRSLEAFGKLGRRIGDPTVDLAIAYMRKTQEPDGSWFGRWGVNYIYGTWQSICGLVEVGVPANDPMVVNAANWLVRHQQPCGGWGESCDTYADPSLRGQGKPTASQTAWALWGLIAAGRTDHSAVERGIRWLIDTQREDGGWNETEFTGTGFPQVFYLRYHYYAIYFPLMALGLYSRETTSKLVR